MSLLDSIMVPCVLLNHIRVDDPYGGYRETWEDGASFEAAISINGSTEAVVAERQGLGEIYTVVTKSNFPLSYHDVFRADGKIYRVTSNSEDAHPTSTVRIRKATAERWELPA